MKLYHGSNMRINRQINEIEQMGIHIWVHMHTNAHMCLT